MVQYEHFVLIRIYYKCVIEFVAVVVKVRMRDQPPEYPPLAGEAVDMHFLPVSVVQHGQDENCYQYGHHNMRDCFTKG